MTELESKYMQCVNYFRSLELNTVGKINYALRDFRTEFIKNSLSLDRVEVDSYIIDSLFRCEDFYCRDTSVGVLTSIQNQVECWRYLTNLYLSPIKIDVSMVQLTHNELSRSLYSLLCYENGETPLTFRQRPINKRGILKSSDNIVDSLAKLLETLRYDFKFPLKALKEAAKFYCEFEKISPFIEFNGRTARSLLNYYLFKVNCPPVIMHATSRAKYYMAIKSYETSGNREPMYEFLLEQEIKTWNSAAGIRDTSGNSNDFP